MEAVANVDAILAVPGISAIFVGPADLSLSLGVQRNDPEVEAAIQTVLKAARSRNMPIGITTSAATVAQRVKEGFNFVTVGFGDGGITPATAQALERGREAAGRKWAAELPIGQFVWSGPLPRAAPHVDHAHDPGAVVDREEDPIDVRPASIAKHANRLIGVDGLRCNRATVWKVVEREDCALEAIEPSRSLLWRAFDDPQVELLEVGFRGPRDFNAVWHACGEGG